MAWWGPCEVYLLSQEISGAEKSDVDSNPSALSHKDKDESRGKILTTMKIKVLLVSLFVTLAFSFSHAHDLFVTVKESMSHHPSHTNIVVGWGHALPMDYFLRGSKIETYAIYDPALTRMDFEFDRKANAIIDGKEGGGQKRVSGRKSHKGLTTQAGHYFGQHVKFQEDSPKGTYQVAVTSKPSQFTMWVNKKGRVKWSDQTLDEIKDAREIKVSKRHYYSAKAFLTVGEWTESKPPKGIIDNIIKEGERK